MQINLEACTKCRACVRDCPSYVLDMDESGPVEKYPENCIECGHCVAVCPVTAIVHERMDMAGFPEIEEPGIAFEQFVHLTRNRRSTRRFKKEPLSREVVDNILDSVRYAPTGENAQELRYLLIMDPAQLQKIKEDMAKHFKMLKNVVKGFYGLLVLGMGRKEAARAKHSLDRLVDKWDSEKDAGEDPFLCTAPVLLIIHAKQKTAISQVDAGIAGYHVNLACETLGIGTVWNGFHQVFSNLFSSTRRVSLVPKGHKVLGSICIGYPAVKYKRNVYRRPVKAKIIG